MSDLMTAVTEIRRVHDDYQRANNYYRGTVDEVFASPAVARALAGSGSKANVNLARRAVDAVLDRMEIRGVTIADDNGAHRHLVDTVWTPNKLGIYSKRIHEAALVFGDAYVIVWPGEQDGAVEVHYNSPLNVRVFYEPGNERVKTYAAKLWEQQGGANAVHRLDLYYSDRVERWVSVPGSRGKAESNWRPFDGDGQDPILEHDFGQVPVFHFRTEEPYGRPVHRDAWDPQDQITKLARSMMAAVDYQILPQRWVMMKAREGERLLRSTDDNVLPGGRKPGSRDQDLKAGPSVVWTLPDGSTAGQFEPADMGSFLDSLRYWGRAMAAATGISPRHFEPQGAVPSGEALRAEDAPLAARIRDTHVVFADEWQQVLMFAAALTGREIPPPDVGWAPVQPVDDLTGWQTVAAKIAAGVPPVVALTEAGYSSLTVEGWAAGSDKTNLDTRLGVLERIAGALQKIGGAVQLEAVDQATVNVILTQLLGELVQESDPAA